MNSGQKSNAFVREFEENFIIEFAFLYAKILPSISGKIDEESRMWPTCSDFWKIGILVLIRDTGFQTNSMDGMFFKFVFVKANFFFVH